MFKCLNLNFSFRFIFSFFCLCLKIFFFSFGKNRIYILIPSNELLLSPFFFSFPFHFAFSFFLLGPSFSLLVVGPSFLGSPSVLWNGVGVLLGVGGWPVLPGGVFGPSFSGLVLVLPSGFGASPFLVGVGDWPCLLAVWLLAIPGTKKELKIEKMKNEEHQEKRRKNTKEKTHPAPPSASPARH